MDENTQEHRPRTRPIGISCDRQTDRPVREPMRRLNDGKRMSYTLDASAPRWRLGVFDRAVSMAHDTEPSDESLVVAVGKRDERALKLLLDRHRGWAARFAERLTGDPQTAEEVVQTAFLRLWNRADRWEGRSRFTTWFYRVLHNLSVDELRRKRIAFEVLDESQEDSTRSPMEQVQSEQTSLRVRRAVLALPQRQRSAIVLSHYEGCSQAEAASIMGVSESALESLLVRGRATLRSLLADQSGGEEE